MKILYVINGLGTGGAEKMLYKLLSRLDRSQFSPAVISLLDRGTVGEAIEALDIPLYTLNARLSLPNPFLVRTLAQIVKTIQPDLIQGRMYHGNLAAQLASVVAPHPIPTLWSIHHSLNALHSEKPMTQALIRLGAQLSHLPRRILYVSHRSQLQHEALGYERQQSHIIPNGCDTDRFCPDPLAASTLKQALGLAPDTVLIGLIARFHPMKDHANFLQAAAQLKQHHSQVHILLAGADIEPSNPHLMQQIQTLGLQQQVHLLGDRQDMPTIMAALDLLCLTSAYGEAFPNVLIEAMACGTPCITTDVGDAARIVDQTGWVIPPQNSAALVTALQEFIALDGDRRQTLSHQARQRVMQQFSLNAIVAQHEQLYHQTLESLTGNKLKKSLHSCHQK
ncbi:MAG: glycosyltransferase [Synechococcales bacterium]|nr:glycosyltransferase [Synechococcales bacterium]